MSEEKRSANGGGDLSVPFSMAGVLFAALLFTYPLIWARLFYKVNLLGYFTIISPGVMAWLALAGCSFKLPELWSVLRRHRWFTVALMIINGVAVSHLWAPNIQLNDIAGSLLWTALPLFALLYYRQVAKLLPWFMGLLWILNIWQLAAEQIWQWHSRMLGVTGNNNWSAALLIVTTAFLLQLWRETAGKRGFSRCLEWSIFALLTMFSLIVLYNLYSKGANIALVFALLATGLLYYGRWEKLSFRIAVLAGMVILAVGTVMIFSSSYFARFVQHDVRLPLWSGALYLIADHWLNGVPAAAFESKFAAYVPVDYYLRGSIAAARNTHPHSHLLYFAAVFGIFATIAWCWLVLFPIVVQLRRPHTDKTDRRMLYLFILLVLLAHSMVDLILFSWPCQAIFLLVLGLLWRETWPVKRDNAVCQFKSCQLLGRGLGIIILAWAFYDGYITGGSSYFRRQALIELKEGKPRQALDSCQRSLVYRITPATLYRAAMIALFDMKNPQLTLKYLKQFNYLPGDSYMSSNGLRARALVVSGRPIKALPFFKRETENYPLGSLNWYFYYFTLKMLKLSEAAQVAKENLDYSLQVKGMTEKDIPILIKHPELDIDFLESDGQTPKINRYRRHD